MKVYKLIFAYFNLARYAAFAVHEHYSCLPDTVGHCAILPSNTSIFLSKSSAEEVLTLTRVTENNNEKEVAPVGRSYNQRDWERVAGPYDYLVFDCSIGNDVCQVTIPEAESNSQSFHLSRFEHRLSIEDKVARFLEQVTFGTKRDELNDLVNAAKMNNDHDNLQKTFALWVDKQINEITPTLHREFFRSRVAPRYNDRSPAPEGKISHPCSSGARWRRFSFTLPDLSKDILITKVSNRYSLSVDGHERTMVDDILFRDGEAFVYTKPALYKLCALGRAQTFIDFGIRYNDKCRRLVLGNLPVDIDGMIPQPTYIFNGVDPRSFITKIDYRDSTKVESMLSTTELFRDYPALCESLSLDYEVPVYTRLTNGQVLMFDPVLEFGTNSLDTPLNDGGGLTSVSTEHISQCANAPRTFVNDAKCRLSSVAACTSSSNISNLSLELNEANLRDIYKKVGKYYYVVQGLRLGESDDASWGVNLPCNELAKSRWVHMENDNCKQSVHRDTAGKKSCVKLYFT